MSEPREQTSDSYSSDTLEQRHPYPLVSIYSDEFRILTSSSLYGGENRVKKQPIISECIIWGFLVHSQFCTAILPM